jgi:hypothetical protein
MDIFLAFVCGTRAQSLSAPFSYTLYLYVVSQVDTAQRIKQLICYFVGFHILKAVSMKNTLLQYNAM